jgi:putative membrane protein
MDKVAQLSGPVFEAKYVELMVKGNEKNVKVFEKQSVQGNDPEVRAWAAKSLSTLRERLQEVRDIQSRLKQ